MLDSQIAIFLSLGAGLLDGDGLLDGGSLLGGDRRGSNDLLLLLLLLLFALLLLSRQDRSQQILLLGGRDTGGSRILIHTQEAAARRAGTGHVNAGLAELPRQAKAAADDPDTGDLHDGRHLRAALQHIQRRLIPHLIVLAVVQLRLPLAVVLAEGNLVRRRVILLGDLDAGRVHALHNITGLGLAGTEPGSRISGSGINNKRVNRLNHRLVSGNLGVAVGTRKA